MSRNSAPGQSFDFYVNSATGSDANDGLTPATAFETISAANAILANGVRIGLARGSEWREQLGDDLLSYTDVVVGAYGSGAMPILDGSDVATGWTYDGAYTNLYSVAWAHDGSVGDFLSVWENGARLRWVASQATADATPGSFYAATISGTPSTIWIHPNGSTNPTNNKKTYTASRRKQGLTCGTPAARWTIMDLHTRKSISNNGSLQAAAPGSVVRRCLAEDGTKHNMFIGADCIAYDCIAWESDWADRTNTTAFVAYVTNGIGRTAKFERCISVMDTAKVTVAVAGADAIEGFYAHTASSAQKWDRVDYVDCSAYGATRAFGVLDCTYFYTSRCFADEFRSGIGSGAATADVVDFYAKGTPANTIAPDTGYSHVGGSVTIDGWRSYCGVASNRGDIYNLIGSSSSVTLQRSVVVRASGQAGFRYLVNGASASNSVSIQGCIIYAPSINQEEVRAIGTLAAENNNYYPSQLSFRVGGTTYVNFAAYRAANPALDVNSVVTNPTLADPANGDFTAGGTLPTNCGLERDPTCQDYTAIPADIEAAKTYLLAMALIVL